MESKGKSKPQQQLLLFTEYLEKGTLTEVREKLLTLHPAEIAHLLESLPQDQRATIWELVKLEKEGDILLHVNDDVRAQLIQKMDNMELVAATEKLATDDLADIIQDLPQIVTREVLQSMDEQHRQRFESVLSYPEDTAGGLMNTDTITLRADITVDVVLRYLRFKGDIPAMTDNLIVIDRKGYYQGLVALTHLLTKRPTLKVAEIMTTDVEPILATLDEKDVANLFEKRDLVSAPVVDENGKLLGRITIDDVVDVIREEADHSILSMAGLKETDDMFAPVVTSSRRRAVWLGVNMITAFMASWVIGLFDATIEKLVALAILMPIVASMGGIAGSQTLTLVIRGIALEQIGTANAGVLLRKELAVGALNGLVWSLVVAAITMYWFGDFQLGVIIALAIMANLVCAALAGASIPIALHKMGIDPAIAGGVILTTVTDIIGFLAFLGLAALFLV